MANLYKPNYQTINKLIIKEIIFEKDPLCTSVTLIGYRVNDDNTKFIKTHYFCEFDMLNNLLVAAKEEGDLIITAIKNKLLSEEEEVPVLLDTDIIIDGLLIIKNLVVKMYKEKVRDEFGNWREEDYEHFNIENIEFVNDKIVNDRLEVLQTSFALNLNMLEARFNYYLQLKSILPSFKMARKKAGLKNKLLFYLAIVNHDILEHHK